MLKSSFDIKGRLADTKNAASYFDLHLEIDKEGRCKAKVRQT
jgi:hypothetical protein